MAGINGTPNNENAYDGFINELNFDGWVNPDDLPPAEPGNFGEKEASFAQHINSEEAAKSISTLLESRTHILEGLSDIEQQAIVPALMLELMVNDFLGATDVPSVQSRFPGISKQEVSFYSKMSHQFRAGMRGSKLKEILQQYGFTDISELDLKSSILGKVQGSDVQGMKAGLEVLSDHIMRCIFAKEFPDQDDFKEAMSNQYAVAGPLMFLSPIELPSDITGVSFIHNELMPAVIDAFYVDPGDGYPTKAAQLNGFAGFAYVLNFYCDMSDKYLNDPEGFFKPKVPLLTRLEERRNRKK